MSENYPSAQAELIAQTMEALASLEPTPLARLETAAGVIANALVNEKQLLVAGTGSHQAMGSYLVGLLSRQPEDYRPMLPAIDINKLCGDASSDGLTPAMARYIYSLGHEGDVLCVFTGNRHSSAASAVQASAAEKGMACVTVETGLAGEQDRREQNPEDGHIVVALAVEHNYQAQLLGFFLGQCLHRIIDQQIFGGA